MYRVLFLCTGNYYRSRFAEILFNHLARQQSLAAVADSRALAIELGGCNIGPLSAHTIAGLMLRKVPVPHPVRGPLACQAADLEAADLIIALKEAEHRRYIAQRHPAWVDRVRYWQVHDLDKSGPAEALGQIDANVNELIRALAGKIQPTPMTGL